MKRIGALTAALVILMAGFMSVCVADENCLSEVVTPAAHGCHELLESKAPVKEAQQDHCGIFCHTAAFSLPQVAGSLYCAITLTQDRPLSIDDTITLGLYTVLDQPPRA